MDRWIFMLLFVLCVFVSSCSQILLKKSANKKHKGIKVFLNKEVVLGYSIFLAVTLCIIFLYQRIELSTGALLESFSYIFIPVLSWCFFKERLNRLQKIGISFIIIGILVYVFWG